MGATRPASGIKERFIHYKQILLTDRTDYTDFFACATSFSTTEMTDLTDFVSIACSPRYWPVTYPWRNSLAQIM